MNISRSRLRHQQTQKILTDLRKRMMQRREFDVMVLLLLLLRSRDRRTKRRCWMYPRSKEWIGMVLSAQVLPGREFERTFWMTRNSFEQLHATLGTYSYYCSNLQSRTLRFRTHVFEKQHHQESDFWSFSSMSCKGRITIQSLIILLLAAQMYPNASMMYLVQSFFMFSRLIFVYQHRQKPNGACVPGKLRQGFLELFVQLMEPISPFHDLVVMEKHFIIGRIFTVSTYKVNWIELASSLIIFYRCCRLQKTLYQRWSWLARFCWRCPSLEMFRIEARSCTMAVITRPSYIDPWNRQWYRWRDSAIHSCRLRICEYKTRRHDL